MNLQSMWKQVNLISLTNEPWLEKWARLFRYQLSLPVLQQLLKSNDSINLLDVGCGQDTLYYKYIKFHFPNDIRRINYVGLDPLIDKKAVTEKNIEIISTNYEKHLSTAVGRYDLITIFAVLEHVDDPTDLIQVLTKLLAPKGVLFGTTPTNLAKPVLEFLSYVLGIISRREIEEHKNYFDRRFIQKIFKAVSKLNSGLSFHHHYFELGLNNAFAIKKNK